MIKRVMSVSLVVVVMAAIPSSAQEAINIGSRRELFVDHHLIDKITGAAKLQLHQPQPREAVLTTDRPWEGNTCAYYTIFRDGDLYRMYYRGSHYDTKTKKAAHREVVCYAESKDGIHWHRPDLELFSFNGSKKNNIVWDGVGGHNFTPFKDPSPNCPPNARYKALARGSNKDGRGLFAFQSADGIRWKLMQRSPVITKGAFDSQNLAFWDPQNKIYREYHRGFTGGVRAIMTGTSKDFINWSDPKFLKYPGLAKDNVKDHLYTNAIRPYPRAPHILIGFPTRYQPRRASQVEPTLMSSRDGLHFHRWTEPVIPVTAPKDRSGNRSNYMAWGLVQLPRNDKEYSVYATEAYYTGPDSRVRRFTYRVDGFVSLHAPGEGGELLTKPLIFEGGNLVVNMKTSKRGRVRIELQDAGGKPIPQFTRDDCRPLQGDALEQAVTWKGGNAARLAGQPVRLCFILEDSDIYSFQFTGKRK